MMRQIENVWECQGCKRLVRATKLEAGGMPVLFGRCSCKGFESEDLDVAIDQLDQAERVAQACEDARLVLGELDS